MVTNLAINEQLLDTAYKIGGYRTKSELDEIRISRYFRMVSCLQEKKLTSDNKKVTDYLTFLIRHQYAIMIGPIHQEILSGSCMKINSWNLRKLWKHFLILKL